VLASTREDNVRLRVNVPEEKLRPNVALRAIKGLETDYTLVDRRSRRWLGS